MNYIYNFYNFVRKREKKEKRKKEKNEEKEEKEEKGNYYIKDIIEKKYINDILHSKNFEMKEKIIESKYGLIYKLINKNNGEYLVLKLIENSTWKDEIKISKMINHPNIVKFFDQGELNKHDKFSSYIIMEYCKFGDIFTHMEIHNNFSEKDSKIIIYQISQAIKYCHSKNIVHRDIKLENILISNVDPLTVKLADFGLSYIKRTEIIKLRIKAGTTYYIPPEMFIGNGLYKYNEKIDIWSLGVVLYMLLSGDPPFNGETGKIINNNIIIGKYYFNNIIWDKITFSAIDLVKSMIEYIPKKRLDINQVLDHKWFNEENSENSENSENEYFVDDETLKLFKRSTV